MLLSMNWINDYVDLSGLDIEALIRKFTLSTAEVEDIYHKGEDVQGVVVGEILSVINHPDSDHLHLLKVDAGNRIYDCVCGAPNVRAGMKVPFAPDGSIVSGVAIQSGRLRGQLSEGMCCSEKELGISDDHSGLWELPSDSPAGRSIKEIYPIDDIVFEVDNKSLTNRPDLWGHYGIAREFAALAARSLKAPEVADCSYTGGNRISVEIRRPDMAYRYSCLRIVNINENRSPAAIRIRLYYCGMRAINLLADLTNYIMLELGQPMHAFDADKIDRIVVDTHAEDTVFTTLDGEQRKIDVHTLLIKNGDVPVAIAGIMGGLDSEIVDGTRSVTLESANFDAVCVRKSSTRLGLRTDSSMRYEKTLDPELTLTAIARFVKLLAGIDKGAYVDSAVTDVYAYHYPAVSLSFDKAFVDRYTGIDISCERIEKTLSALGFGVDRSDRNFTVSVPSWRATKDVTLKADIIEEITRIYGYDNFEIASAKSLLHPVRLSAMQTESWLIKDILVQKFNLNEVHSYIWNDGRKYKELGIETDENTTVLNIAAPEYNTLRNTMIPSLLSFVYDNRRISDDFGLFEIGRIADGTDEKGLCNEKRRLGVTLFSKTLSEKDLYFKSIGILRCLCAEIKHDAPVFHKANCRWNWQHPRNTSILQLGGVDVGMICTLHPVNIAKIDRKAAVVCFEIDIDSFASVPPKQLAFHEPSRFPTVDFDLSLILKDGIAYADLENAWKKPGILELAGVTVIDQYASDELRSMTVRLSFVSDERTLSMEEVQRWIDIIVSNLKEIGIEIRAI